MHLDRKDRITDPGVHSIICPSSRVNTADVIRECRAVSASGALHRDSRYHWSHASTWHGFRRTDATDCDALEKSLDASQCAWNASWVDDFKVR